MTAGFRIEDIDKNFITDKAFDPTGLKFYNVLEKPFKIYGLILPDAENERFLRMPREIADNTSHGVSVLNYHTAGGRVRFRTNSKRIAVFASLYRVMKMSHFAFSGTVGMDVYVNGKFSRTFIPPLDVEDNFAMVKSFSDSEMKEIQLNLPLYSGISELHIGLDEGAIVEEGRGYDYDLPIVYYGSSITQGACASRPGNSYEAIIERETNCDYVNLGFSGSAKGEKIVAEHIASLDMKIFVLDYDHNAPSVKELNETHEPFYKTIREKHPELPIIMATRPDCSMISIEEARKRKRIVRRTYLNAKKRGENVYFIDGEKMMRKYAGADGTVEGIHPNDFGFRAIAKGIGDIIKKILKSK